MLTRFCHLNYHHQTQLDLSAPHLSPHPACRSSRARTTAPPLPWLRSRARSAPPPATGSRSEGPLGARPTDKRACAECGEVGMTRRQRSGPPTPTSPPYLQMHRLAVHQMIEVVLCRVLKQSGPLGVSAQARQSDDADTHWPPNTARRVLEIVALSRRHHEEAPSVGVAAAATPGRWAVLCDGSVGVG